MTTTESIEFELSSGFAIISSQFVVQEDSTSIEQLSTFTTISASTNSVEWNVYSTSDELFSDTSTAGEHLLYNKNVSI